MYIIMLSSQSFAQIYFLRISVDLDFESESQVDAPAVVGDELALSHHGPSAVSASGSGRTTAERCTCVGGCFLSFGSVEHTYSFS